jgi:hypothetical protein
LHPLSVVFQDLIVKREDCDQLYVTTTGGLIMPFEGKPQEAKLVQVAVGQRGFALPVL